MNASSRAAEASIAGVLAAMAAAVLDTGLVTLALPMIGKALDAQPTDAILVLGAYQLALLIGLLPAAHLAERFGYRRLFRGGIGLFLTSALVCFCAQSLGMLLAARFFQGLGAAGIMALGIAVLRAALGDQRLASAIAWNALTVALCSAAAPAIGALLLTAGSWRIIFLVSLPLGFFALFTVRALPETKGTLLSVDLPAIAAYALAAGLLFQAVRLLLAHTVAAIASGLLGTAALYLLMQRPAGSGASLLPTDLLTDRIFGASVAASICCFTAQSAGVSALTFYLQGGLRATPLQVGLVLTCWPLAVIVASLAGPRLSRRNDPRTRCATGAVLMATGLAIVAISSPPVDLWVPAIAAATCGAGFGLFQLANNQTLFLGVRPERSAAAGGMQGTARLAGQTLGTLVVGIAFASVTSSLVAPRPALAAGAAFAALSAAISVLRPSIHKPRS